MTYDLTGLGIAEVTFINLYYPLIGQQVNLLLDQCYYEEALNLARKTIAVHNAKMFTN